MAYTSNAPAQNVASTATQNGGVAHNNNQATAFSPSHSTLSIQMAVPEPETFMGIPVQNPKKAKLVKIVYWLVMLAVLLETSQFILYVSDRTGTSTLLSAGEKRFGIVGRLSDWTKCEVEGRSDGTNTRTQLIVARRTILTRNTP